MNHVHQFHELFQRGCPGIKLSKGRINLGKIKGGVGAAKPPHAGIGGWGGMYRQQLQDTAAKMGKNKFHLFCKIPEFP